jgi:VanZ like family
MALFRSRREQRLWLQTVALFALVCGTIYPAPFALEFLRVRNLLRLTVAAILLTAIAALVVWLVRQRPGRNEWWLLGSGGVLYAGIFWFLPVPQERLHFLEYGALAVLANAALEERQLAAAASSGGAWWKPGLLAITLTALLGWADEGIQALVPNRYYDLRDVGFNALGAVLAIAIAYLRRRARRADGARRVLASGLTEGGVTGVSR